MLGFVVCVGFCTLCWVLYSVARLLLCGLLPSCRQCGCSSRGVRGFVAVASLVAEHGLEAQASVVEAPRCYSTGLSSWGAWA